MRVKSIKNCARCGVEMQLTAKQTYKIYCSSCRDQRRNEYTKMKRAEVSEEGRNKTAERKKLAEQGMIFNEFTEMYCHPMSARIPKIIKALIRWDFHTRYL